MIVSLDLDTLLKTVNGSLMQTGGNFSIRQVLTDSRKVISGADVLFVALKGPHYNGEDFIHQVYLKGIRVFLIQNNSFQSADMNEGTFILVEDTQKALQDLAAYQRQQFQGQVISLTGSNGKTIIKEWLSQLLEVKYPTYKSPKSFNSQIGVPLSVFGIEASHKIAILEAGISTSGEMQYLERIIKPNLLIFTNLGSAHQEGFLDKGQKLQEKAILGKDANFIIYRKEQKEIAAYFESNFPQERLISWSDSPGADYCLSVRKDADQAKIILLKPDLQVFTFTCAFHDEASLENLRHVITAALTLGMTPKEIQNGIAFLKPLEMRMTIKQGVNDSIIIDDTYSNDLEGLKVALDFMHQQRPKKRKIVILSDFLQAGNEEWLYLQVAQLLRQYKIDLVYGIGGKIPQLRQHLKMEAHFFGDTRSFLDEIQPDSFHHDILLVTGARKFQFESIVNHLQQRVHGTTLEINLNAVSQNFHFYRQKLKPETKIMVMVKAFAYGGGSVEIANHLQQLNVDFLAVAYTDEGVYLRKHGIHLPIMVLNPSPESFPLMLSQDLEPVVYSFSLLKQLGNFCMGENKKMKIHLDLDTGMHRLGFGIEDLEELIKILPDYPLLQIASIYTHLAGADETVYADFSLSQLREFQLMAEKISSLYPDRPLFHALNSAGILNFPEYQMDMVRLGIGLYGVEVTGKEDASLQPISTLKTTISQIKNLPKGSTIGYSRKGIMPDDGQIATIAIGYADGYDRRFSNGNGYVLIHGKKAPVIGNVCMDMTMVDITGISAREGDEVTIYGEGISLKDLANRIVTIPYELLTNISSRVKRVYYLD
jgi:Alr-MurF fusion protein